MDTTLIIVIAVAAAFILGTIVSIAGSGAGYIAFFTAAGLVFPVLIVTMMVSVDSTGQPDGQTVVLVLTGLFGIAALVMWVDFIIAMIGLAAEAIDNRRRPSRGYAWR